MKMSNDDIKKITEIKQYLLDPPISFKLHEYALSYLQNVISVLKAYPKTENDIQDFEILIDRIKDKQIELSDLRNALKQAGIKLSRLTNK
ncbi:MAG: hypothetical protein JO072_05935 [Parafilimonas sp.]|nr:hypothetical protein [Parafilimonas sp.]